jgi:hypothetical protein
MILRRILFCAVLALLTSCTGGSRPSGDGHAALVVVHGDGTVTKACVGLQGATTTGEQLLARSGLAVSLDAANAMGSLVCAIDGEGCAHPPEECLCQCRGPGGCSYWAYFNRTADGRWQYGAQGAGMRTVHDGDIDAWVWLDRSLPGAAVPPPPDVDFLSICP